MTVDIQPVQIWVAGEQKTATKFTLVGVFDDFGTYATLYYQLQESNPEDPTQTGSTLSQGNQTINGADYTTWDNDPNANEWIMNWSLTQLGLTLA